MLRKVKENNEKILKGQEDLNDILSAKIHNDEKEKNKESEHDLPKTAPYKCKGWKLEFSSHKPKTSSEELVKCHWKPQESSESNDDNKKKNKHRPYEEIYGEFKKIKPPMFNGEIEKGEEAAAWLSRMKKYFQIYNYSDELKHKITIYIMTGKTYIW